MSLDEFTEELSYWAGLISSSTALVDNLCDHSLLTVLNTAIGFFSVDLAAEVVSQRLNRNPLELQDFRSWLVTFDNYFRTKAGVVERNKDLPFFKLFREAIAEEYRSRMPWYLCYE
jgi:hypothetical protein